MQAYSEEADVAPRPTWNHKIEKIAASNKSRLKREALILTANYIVVSSRVYR